ncbi:MAG: DoxX family protein [Deltaproteobacteria bacterium]|nr:DoxX family protein [Deltaproteobacteria bacterium]
MTAPSRAVNIAAWIASALLFLLFTVAASPPKLLGDPQAVEGFAKSGFSDAFRLFIGASEFLGGIALLIPPLAFWSACGLTIIMIGAAYTHVANHDVANIAPALIALALCVFIAVVRRGRALFLS